MSLLYWLLGLDEPTRIAAAREWHVYAAMPPAAWAVALVSVAALLAAGLNLLPHNVMPRRTRVLLTLVRLAGFALVLLMLAQVELRVMLDRQTPATVAVLTDTSASMGLRDAGDDTRLASAQRLSDQAADALAGQADVVRYAFDWDLSPQTAGPAAEPSGNTRLIDAVRNLAQRENNLRAVVLMTDGNDTAGDRGQLLAPVLASRRLPVYPVVIGDPDAPRLAQVRVSEGGGYVRLGDELRLSATLSAANLDEQSVSVRLYEQGKDEPIAVRENVRLGGEPVEVSFVIKPEKPGDRTYRIALEGVQGSATTQTLAAEHRVSVIDAKIKVLYLDIPRDERKILAHWLARDPVVDLAVLTLMPKGGWYAQGTMLHPNAGDGLPNREADLYQYDVIIFGDIPRAYFRQGGDVAETKMRRLAEFVSRRGGGLVTLGGRSVYAAGLYQDSALAAISPFVIEPTNEPQIDKAFNIAPTPMGLAHPIMQLEADPAANREAWLDLPTLDGCNRVGRVKPGASLLAQRLLEGGSAVPVIALQNVGKGQVLGLSADTTWRWEMMRPEEGEDYFRRFWGNAVRALAPDPRLAPHRPRVIQYQTNPAVGQTVTLATRLVDDVYQPVQGADLSVKVTSPSGAVTMIYPRDGRNTPGLYEYELALTEAGRWTVETTYRDQTTAETVVAGAANDELIDPRAKPEAMAAFATATGGKTLTSGQVGGLAEVIDLSPRLFTQTATVALWNLPATMAALIALVCLDAWVRKRRGMV